MSPSQARRDGVEQSRLWLPYAQMRTAAPPWKVVRAEGVRLHLDDGRSLIDAVSSWWCAIHGYNHPDITRAVKAQLDQVPHVMLGGLVHEPAIRLAQRLVEITPAPLTHVFFGDSGSVGVEIALKMAIQFWRNQGRTSKTRMMTLLKAYHGDTTGAMAVGDPVEGMHHLFAPLLPRHVFAPSPRGGFDAPDNVVRDDLDQLAHLFAGHHEELAGFIVEPLMQLAGGFNFYSPAYLQGASKLCDQYGVLLIFDEVATGFGRTGSLFAADLAQVCPDILVLGKALTAGYSGHSATLATDRVYDAFLGDDPALAFMHGPTYMGNPTVCAAALAGLDVFFRDDYLARVGRIQTLLRRDLLPLSSPKVRDVRVLGACGVVEVHDPGSLIGLQQFAADRGVWLRPFDRYAYLMPPYVITDDDLRQATAALREWFS
ncbi:MAG: adenosylmethionine--8-amino-7-oxononanoate transaminase [Phycisphaeraceae bacterium]|nr:adenosylmethionine--8-amino-7-oxononanoate transaminase [Phycisphaeraceae bacterium]